jgi:hypothetical protein
MEHFTANRHRSFASVLGPYFHTGFPPTIQAAPYGLGVGVPQSCVVVNGNPVWQTVQGEVAAQGPVSVLVTTASAVVQPHGSVTNSARTAPV